MGFKGRSPFLLGVVGGFRKFYICQGAGEPDATAPSGRKRERDVLKVVVKMSGSEV